MERKLVSQLKASAFCIWQNKLWWFQTQQLILGTGTAVWWVTEPHWLTYLVWRLMYKWGARYLAGENLKVVWAELLTLS